VNIPAKARTNRARIAFPKLAKMLHKMPLKLHKMVLKEPVKNFLFLRTNCEGIGSFGN